MMRMSAEDQFHRSVGEITRELNEAQREQAYRFLTNLTDFVRSQMGGAGSVPISPVAPTANSATCPHCGQTITLS